MSLHVNLILKNEKRSSSVLNINALIRIAGISVPMVFLLLLALNLIGIMILSSELRSLKSQWELDQPREARAVSLSNQLKETTGIKKELDGWQKSRIDWHAQLSALQDAAPENIQINLLNLTQIIKVLDNKKPTRAFALTLKGKAAGSNAEADVQNLKQQLMNSTTFADKMEEVVVKKYGADTSKDAKETDRIFEIECTYSPRTFE